MGIGDWGLGIGDWAKFPRPNAPAPIAKPQPPYLIFQYYIIENNNKKQIK